MKVEEDIDHIASEIVKKDRREEVEPDYELYSDIAAAIQAERDKHKWNHDMTAAPRGHTESRTVKFMRNGEQVERKQNDFVPDRILGARKNGQVIMTYWIPQTFTQEGKPHHPARWSGLIAGEELDAWMPWPEYAPAKVEEES